jgi:predicted amidophosphoribosyltransferase
VYDALLDLGSGSSCLGCHRPGRLLCPACRDGLPASARHRPPVPCPEGLAPAWSCGSYDGLLRDLVLGHKEQGLHALVRPLGELLATAVSHALDEPGGAGVRTGRVVLVPAPSRRASLRARGYDATWAMTRAATVRLRRAGYDALAARLLDVRGPLLDQAGLDRTQRAHNLHGSLWCPSSGLDRLARRAGSGVVVACDDVLTTGATAREVQRALSAVGLPPVAIATVAATQRRAAQSLVP